MGSGEEEERKEGLRKTGERSEENTLVKHTHNIKHREERRKGGRQIGERSEEE